MNRIFAIVAAALLAACATSSHQFAAPDAGWKSATGQLRYQHGERTIIGELAVSRGADGARVEFTKAGSLALMRVFSDKTHVRFEGPLARGTREYSQGATLPGHLATWTQLIGAHGKGTLSGGGDTLTYQLPPLR